MTDDATRSAVPPPLPASEAVPIATGDLLAALLKAPQRVAAPLAADTDAVRAGCYFLVGAVMFHGIFGLATGFFGGWSVASMTAAKAMLIALCSLALCLPSLYVFSAVGGSPLSMTQTFMLGASCLAMIGLLLIGLAPVAWLFAVSTSNLPFVVMLVFLIWLLSVGFAMRYVRMLKVQPLFQRSSGILVWLAVFVLVSLQMTTCLRPVLTTPHPGHGWWTPEKAFFLGHYASCFEDAKPAGATPPGHAGR